MKTINYSDFCLNMTREDYENTDFYEIAKNSIRESIMYDNITRNYRDFKVTLDDGEVIDFRIEIAPSVLRFEGIKCSWDGSYLMRP